MKSIKNLIIAITLLFGHIAHAQNATLTTTERWIKAGNSLREAHQYEQGENYLLRGLDAARRLNNNYWEAVASEYLGLLYANTNEITTAGQYFNNALHLYQTQNLSLSARVVQDLMNDYNISNEQQAGQLYGGIEIGARGVKYSILRSKQKNGHLSFIPVKDSSINTLIIDFTPTALAETGEAVKTFLDILSHYREPIPPGNIFIAISSGVKQEADKVPGREDQLKNALRTAVPTYSKNIDFLTVCQEGDLTIRGVVPSAFFYSSSLVDVGSGNTKGGYRVRGENNARCMGIRWGTATFARKIAGRENISEYATKFFEDSIKPAIHNEIERNPGLTNRQIGYFSGGIFWAMCNYLHPEHVNDDFTEFNENDVNKFLNDALNNYDALINPDLTRINDNDVSTQARKQIASSQTTFNRDNIIAGALIIKGIISEMKNTGVPNKRFYFAKFGYVGWISGYIVNQVNGQLINLND